MKPKADINWSQSVSMLLIETSERENKLHRTAADGDIPQIHQQ